MAIITPTTHAATADPARANLAGIRHAQRRALAAMLGSTEKHTRRFGRRRYWLITSNHGHSLRIADATMRKLKEMGLVIISDSGRARLTAIGQWYAATAAVLEAEIANDEPAQHQSAIVRGIAS